MKESLMTRGLLEPVDLRGLVLPTRIVMAPMTRSRAMRGVPDDLTVRYYEQRASAGLIVSEGSPVSQEGTGWVYTPGLYTDEHVAGWRRVTEAVRARDGRIFAQLWHVGRASHVALQADGQAPVSSTAKDGDVTFALTPEGIPGFIPTSPPRALETGEVARVVDDFVAAAGNADAAGFHGVEIHGATRFLFEQFLNAAFNDRTDRYGAGSLADRLRFTLEVVDGVSGRVGASRVGVRISPFSTIGNMPVDDQAEETYRALVRELADRGLAYVHIHDTSYAEGLPGESTPSAQIRGFLERVRPDLGGMAMVLAGGLTRDSATGLIDDELIDLAAFGRPYISNPDLVERFGAGAELNDADPDTFYGGAGEGYVDYPAADPPRVDRVTITESADD
jgi:N-ethylmaleimide reductase